MSYEHTSIRIFPLWSKHVWNIDQCRKHAAQEDRRDSCSHPKEDILIISFADKERVGAAGQGADDQAG